METDQLLFRNAHIYKSDVVKASEKYSTKKEAAKHLDVDYTHFQRVVSKHPDLMELFPSKQEVEQRRFVGCISGVTKRKMKKAIEEGDGYKAMSKRFDLHPSTIYRMAMKWRLIVPRGN